MTKQKIWLIIATFTVLCVSVVVALQGGYKGNISVEADDALADFSDVNENDWFYEDVVYAGKNGLMNGTSDILFSPNANATRGMIVTILWRIDEKPVEDGKQFADVGSDAYYRDAVSWAANHQIVSGYDENTFAPNDFATREQLATILYRYAEYKGYDTSKVSSLDEYSDKNSISEYALMAMEWANATGIITGTSKETLSPRELVQRCQIAAMLHRFCEQFNVTNPVVTTDASEDTSQETPPLGETEESATNFSAGSHSSGDKASSSKNSSDEKTSSTTESSQIETPAISTDAPEASTTKSSADNGNSYPEIVVNNAEAKPGEDVQATMEIHNNPGILGMSLTVFYDDSNLTLESVENGEAFENVLNLTTSKSFKSGTKFLWDGISIEQSDVKDGIVLTMNFRVNETADVGEYSISFAYADGDIVDNNLIPVSVQMTDGLIVVK